MPHIQQLDAHVADLIAAGEVVERPASVVKELCENAIDAGAHSVTVEIQNGGMTLIRVTDDGCGIAPDECATAFLRHATSKIRNEYDLEAIGTLGFRGEALAATAAVSRIELLTRRAEDPLGTSLVLEGGEVVGQEEAGCPMGTTLLVRDLFFNTPARLKFMKKDVHEGAACLAAVQRQALSHPEVAFKFIRDGRQELLTPGDGQLHSAMYAVLGRDLALGFTPVNGSGEDMSVSGFVSLPTCCRGNRSYQFFFVNGRYVKSPAMTAALEQAYANQKMVGKFPGCVLHLTTKLGAVDVNVHPTKQEVKFDKERAVFSAVYYAVLSALGGDRSRPQAAEALHPVVDRGTQTSLPLFDVTKPRFDSSARPAGAPRPTASAPKAEEQPHAGANMSRPTVSVPPGAEGTPHTGTAIRRPAAPTPSKAEAPSAEPAVGASSAGRNDGPMPSARPHIPSPSAAPAPSRAEETPAKAEEPLAVEAAPAPIKTEEPPAIPSEGPTLPPEETPWRIAGELFHTYVIVEQGDKALLIDKHAAHERMNFDRMRAADYTPMSQILLTPVVFTPAPEEHATLLEYAAELDKVGFEVEDFGGGALVVRRAPDYLDAGEVPAALTEAAGKLSLTGTTGETERLDGLYHTMACKAAIKGGWKSAPQELEAVVKAVLSGQVKYCPHGRPVAVELTKSQLEKQFKRRV